MLHSSEAIDTWPCNTTTTGDKVTFGGGAGGGSTRPWTRLPSRERCQGGLNQPFEILQTRLKQTHGENLMSFWVKFWLPLHVPLPTFCCPQLLAELSGRRSCWGPRALKISLCRFGNCSLGNLQVLKYSNSFRIFSSKSTGGQSESCQKANESERQLGE